MINFSKTEFDCRCSYGCGLGYDQMDHLFLTLLDAARTIAGVPFVITSAIRCKRHNDDVGGKPGSSHLVGLAVDIYCPGSSERYQIVDALISVGIDRIGIGADFVHCDADPSKPAPIIFDYY